MLSFLKSLGIIEFCLVQTIIYLLLWLSNTYLASMLTAVLTPIFFGILIVALIAELIDRSKVPRSFFMYIGASAIIPLLVAAYFTSVYPGAFDWMTDFNF